MVNLIYFVTRHEQTTKFIGKKANKKGTFCKMPYEMC